uniref:Uncharacterized protein n=1 Tax=Ignavibacterium album TaxID=591197 RepID=A0A832G6Z5_9BACT
MEIKPQPITPEYSAPTYTPCGPWITSYDRNNPWQVVWNSISFAPDPYQQMFNFQANRYGPGLQRRTYKFDPEKTYNITLIQSNEYAYFTYGGFYDNTTGSWVPIQYVGTELTGVIGSDLGATSIYDYTQDYPNGLYHNESKYRLRIKRDVPSGTEIIMSVYDGMETINYHTRVEVPTFTIGSITDEDTLLHYYSREVEFILNFQHSCQLDGYGGAYPTGIKFNVDIIQGQEYGNLYYPGTVADPEQSGASIINLEDEYGQSISNYTIKFRADGVQPDEQNPGIVTIRCSANDMDIAPVEISFPVKYNTDPPDEGGSIVVEFDKENYKPGETAVANCKWLTGYDELIDFPIDQRFSVEITGGSEYGVLQDAETGVVSNILEDVSNGFRVITAAEIAEEEERIILKVRTTVGGGIPTRALKQNDLEAEERNNRGDNSKITPELLVIGGEEIIGYGTVLVKKVECSPLCIGEPPFTNILIKRLYNVYFEPCEDRDKDPTTLELGGFTPVKGKDKWRNPSYFHPCFDGVKQAWRFYMDDIQLNITVDFCQNYLSRYIVINNISEVDSNEVCDAVKDFKNHEFYPLKVRNGGYIIMELLKKHEEIHERVYFEYMTENKEDFDRILFEFQPTCEEYPNQILAYAGALEKLDPLINSYFSKNYEKWLDAMGWTEPIDKLKRKKDEEDTHKHPEVQAIWKNYIKSLEVLYPSKYKKCK